MNYISYTDKIKITLLMYLSFSSMSKFSKKTKKCLYMYTVQMTKRERQRCNARYKPFINVYMNLS